MRLPCVQNLAAATTDATMSSYRASYKGRNSWRRGFSDASSGRRDEFVSGDSHFSSVGDANRTFRPEEHRQPSPYQQAPRFQQPPPFHHQPPPFHQQPPPYRQQPPPYHQRQPPFRQPPPSQQHQPYFRAPPPFRQPSNHPRRPQNYKPPDYRNWEYALSQPPSHCERFVVLSYNILADYLAIDHRHQLYCHIPRHVLDWEWRKRKILFELGLWSPDIMCLQEVDRFQELEDELKLSGYSGIWKMRTGIPVDGCAIFWRTTRFKLLYEESIEYNKLELRDNVAQICVLESRSQNSADIRSDAIPQSSKGMNRVVICNIHVLYNPKRGEIKIGQVKMLLERAYAVSSLWNDAPVIICGDFNCTPESPLYNFISQQKLDLMGLPRDQISGQSSAEISNSRPYAPGIRVQTPDNSNQASLVGEVKEVGVKQIGYLPDLYNHNKQQSYEERAAVTSKLHQSQSTTGAGYTSDKSCADMRHGIENSALSDESSKGIENGTKDSYIDKDSSSLVAVHEHGAESTGSTDESLPGTSTRESQSNLDTSGLLHFTMQEVLVHDHMDKGTPCMKENQNSPESNVYHAESRHVEKLGNACRQDITSELVQDTSLRIGNEVSLPESCGDRSLELTTDEEITKSSTSDQSVWGADSNIPAGAVFSEDQKLFPHNILAEGTESDESFGQAHTSTLLLEVCRTEDVFQADVDSDNKSSEPDLIQESSSADGGNVSLSESLGNSRPQFATGEEKTISLRNLPPQFTTVEGRTKSSTTNRPSYALDSDVLTSVDLNKDQKFVQSNMSAEITELGSSGQPCDGIPVPEVDRTGVFQSVTDQDEKSVRPESGETDDFLKKDAMSPPQCRESWGNSPDSIYSDIVARGKYTYDPSSWTPMEIKKASGNEECTLVEHPLKLRSTYTEVEDSSGTRDSSREPQVTSYHRRFMGTVDYIWRSEGLQTVKVLDTIPKHALQWTPGFPTQKWGSDHIALASQLAFTKGK